MPRSLPPLPSLQVFHGFVHLTTRDGFASLRVDDVVAVRKIEYGNDGKMMSPLTDIMTSCGKNISVIHTYEQVLVALGIVSRDENYDFEEFVEDAAPINVKKPRKPNAASNKAIGKRFNPTGKGIAANATM